MSMFTILFWVMAVITIVPALYIAYSNNLVRSIFMFFITLFGLAGLYVYAMADFVAITQIVIYVGGILVLILFAFMLSGRETLERLQQSPVKLLSLKKVPALLVSALFLIVLVNVILKANVDHQAWIDRNVQAGNVIAESAITTDNIGINLMTRYLLPFEAVSVLLLMALVGSAHLARKEQVQ